MVAPEYQVTVFNKITNPLPGVEINSDIKKLLEKCPLADENFDETSPIDLLIDCSLFVNVITGASIQLWL